MGILHHWFAQPLGLALLALLPALGGVALLAARRRRCTLARWGSLAAVRTLAIPHRFLRACRVTCLLAGLILVVVGIAGPQWGRDWDQAAAPGRDLVLVLDLSRSMLAQDVLPSRLGRARQALEDLSYTVQQHGGHRLALVAFAARAKIVCPLTHDYDHFRTALADCDAVPLPADLRPAGEHAVSGTRIGAGLRAAVEAQDPRFRGYQDILLVSDGDDPARDGEWREGAEAARLFRIPVHTVGVGNPAAGSPIPGKDGKPLRHDGQVVLTRLEEQPLMEIARLTGGTYTPARTSALPLGEIFRERIEPGATHEDADDPLPVYRQRYPWFFASALSLLGFEMVLGRHRKRKEKGAKGKQPGPVAALLALALIGALAGAAPLLKPDALVRQGNRALAAGDLPAAVACYTQAEERTTDPGLVAYNEGVALYQLGHYRETELHFRRSWQDAAGPRLARLLYGLGNCLVQQARPTDVARFREAIQLYEQCLRQEATDPALAADARHNLELARLLWLEAKARRQAGDREDPEQDSAESSPNAPGHDDRPGTLGLEAASPDPHGKPQPLTGPLGEVHPEAAPTDQPAPPGKGNLPPLPDEDELVPLSPEDAAEHLKQAAGRIERERQEHRLGMVPTVAAGVKDW